MGPTVVALRIPAVLAGVVAVVGIGWMTRETLQSPTAGLVAAVVAAVSYWPLNFSRIAFSAALLPAVISLAVAALMVALRRRSHVWAGVAAALFALSLFTYAASRVVFIFLGMLLFLAAWWSWPLTVARRRQMAVFAAVFAVSCLPFALGLFQNPAALSQRASSVSVRWAGDLPTMIAALMENLGLALGKYQFFADPNFRHGFAPFPVLDYLTGLLVTLGIVVALGGVFRGLKYRSKIVGMTQQIFGLAVLVIGFATFLIPEVLTDDSNPHALRAIGTMPFIFALVSLAMMYVKNGIGTHRNVLWGRAFLLLALVLISLVNLSTYFLLFARSEQAQAAFDPSLTTFARSVAASDCKLVEVSGLERPETAVVDFFLLKTGSSARFIEGEASELAFFCAQ